MYKLRFRQVHLDFHTSPKIPGIGKAFDKKHWCETLKKAHVNSITCFSKCHHGWSYHPTQVGKMHPHLQFDLLRAQFDACKEIDINVPIYISAGVDNVASYEWPQWREVSPDGHYAGWAGPVIQAGFHKMCFNTPYLDYLCEQIREVARLFGDADGIFLDIISQGQCCCRWCLEVMEQNGLDARAEADRVRCSEIALERYYRETTAASRCDRADMPVFHNSGHISRGKRDVLKYFSHLELESLPTGGWGYDHFPMSAKYCKKLDLDFLGMTGKFHTTWGEFGGYKHPNALRYECAAMLAYGSKCSVGDQLHPEGGLDDSTYEIIGAAYKEVEEKETWCEDAESVADVGLLSSASVKAGAKRDDEADTGAVRVLLEGHFLFDVLDAEMDFSPYKMIVLPDDVPVEDGLKSKLDAYLAAGGKLFMSGASGLAADGSGFVFDIGADHFGVSEFSPDYVLPDEALRPGFVDSPLVMYCPSQKIKVTSGRSLGDVYNPYFNRSFKHFCSHQHTPPETSPSGFAGGVMSGNICYLAHPVFKIYRAFGAVTYQEYAIKALRALLGDDDRVETNMPSTARLTMTRQAKESRCILHLLYANTINRGGEVELTGGSVAARTRSVEVIEELLPLRDVELKVKIDQPVRKLSLEPQGVEIKHEAIDGRIVVRLDEFTCHQMVVYQS